jgi:hypothetical protein
MLSDTILSLEQDEDILPKLIDVMIELLWTFTFSTSTNIHDNLQKRVDLCQWLKTNITDSLPNIRFTSQAILSTLDLSTQTPSKILMFFCPISIILIFSSNNNTQSSFNNFDKYSYLYIKC